MNAIVAAMRFEIGTLMPAFLTAFLSTSAFSAALAEQAPAGPQISQQPTRGSTIGSKLSASTDSSSAASTVPTEVGTLNPSISIGSIAPDLLGQQAWSSIWLGCAANGWRSRAGECHA